MTNTHSIQHILGALNLPEPVPALLDVAQLVVERATGNPALTNPQPTPAAITQAINAVDTAQAAVRARTAGAVAQRNAAKQALVLLLHQYRGYVQTVADANPANAAAIIQGAGLAVKKVPPRAAKSFAAKVGALSGSAKLVAPSAGRRASYEWSYSTDGGKTWVAAPATLQAKTAIPGLPVATAVQFRYRAVIKTGEGNWSQPVTLVVQ